MGSTKKNNYRPDRRELMKYVTAGIVLSTFVGLFLFANEDAEAFQVKGGGSCRGNELCQSLEGKEFDLIKYSSMRSELVILYDRDKTGDISVRAHKSSYKKEKGTINDALRFLSGHTGYHRFKIRQGRKSLGWFSSELLDGVYVLEPVYISSNEFRAARYSFMEREQRIEVVIRPAYRHLWEDDD